MGEQTVDVRGTKVSWEVDGRGFFSATIDGQGYQADTLEGLRTKLVSATKRAAARVSVPFVEAQKSGGERTLRRGTAYGRHGGSRKVLVEWEGGLKTQESLYGEQIRALDPEEFEEGRGLLAALEAAERAWSRFERSHALDVSKEVDRAVAEVVGEPVRGRFG